MQSIDLINNSIIESTRRINSSESWPMIVIKLLDPLADGDHLRNNRGRNKERRKFSITNRSCLFGQIYERVSLLFEIVAIPDQPAII